MTFGSSRIQNSHYSHAFSYFFRSSSISFCSSSISTPSWSITPSLFSILFSSRFYSLPEVSVPEISSLDSVALSLSCGCASLQSDIMLSGFKFEGSPFAVVFLRKVNCEGVVIQMRNCARAKAASWAGSFRLRSRTRSPLSFGGSTESTAAL